MTKYVDPISKKLMEETIELWKDEYQAIARAVDQALQELGVPGEGYPAPVANAVRILQPFSSLPRAEASDPSPDQLDVRELRREMAIDSRFVMLREEIDGRFDSHTEFIEREVGKMRLNEEWADSVDKRLKDLWHGVFERQWTDSADAIDMRFKELRDEIAEVKTGLARHRTDTEPIGPTYSSPLPPHANAIQVREHVFAFVRRLSNMRCMRSKKSPSCSGLGLPPDEYCITCQAREERKTLRKAGWYL